jgi:hypothetical protein
MSRVFRGLVVRDRIPESAQIQTMKERLALSQENRYKCKMKRFNQPSLEILAHGRRTATDLDVFAPLQLASPVSRPRRSRR